jgi:O-antigen ligase
LPRIQARIISIVQLSQGFLARPARWLAGMSVLRSHPFGVGLGNYATAVQDFTLRGMISYPTWFINIFTPSRIATELNKYRVGNAGPHSDFFRLLVELGFIGVGLLIIYWIFLFKRMFNYSSEPVALSLVATMIYLFFQQLVNSQLFAGRGGIRLVLFLSIFLTYEFAMDRNSSFMS